MQSEPTEVGVDHSTPIPLDLPKGLVSENAFRWPADPIARGGMAQIFAGEDKRLGRTVILKAPREGDDLPPGMADMFQRRVTAEARILAKLQHPAIVTIYELGKATVGWPFCVLQRVEGVALRDRLDELFEAEKDGTPRTRERLELLSNLVAIAEALAYAHERRVVHRDCTPNNILLGKRGEATLIDWGIARDLDAPGGGGGDAVLADEGPSASGRMVTISAGTPPYLPLEQTQGRQADPSFDVYSFGVTLYEVVSGRTPFEWVVEKTPQARTKQLDAFLSWLKSNEEAGPAMPRDPELSGIIARATSRDADRRFTADELVRALKQYLTGDLVFSHRYSRTGRLARWAGRHRAATVTMAFLVLSVVAGALVWGQLSRQAVARAHLETEAANAKSKATESQHDAELARRAADEANKEAEEANKKADEAKRDGRNSDAERALADAARARATSLQAQSLKAAKVAESNAESAKHAQETAEQDRDAARTAQSDAERARDAAQGARQAAEHERDVAHANQLRAEQERDASKAAAVLAEQERESARTGQANAEKERDAATASRAAAEKERDDARRQLVLLQGKVHDSDKPDGSAATPTPEPTR